jgi:hypothetical protein
MTPAEAIDVYARALNFHLKNTSLHFVPETIDIPRAELSTTINSLANIFMHMVRKKSL